MLISWRSIRLHLLFIALTSLVLYSCSANNLEKRSSQYRVGGIEIDRPNVLTDPVLTTAVDNAIGNHSMVPNVNNCTDLALWFRDGLEAMFEGDLLQLIQNDPSTHTARQIVPSVAIILNTVTSEMLKADPTLCPKHRYIEDLETLPEPGPNALKAQSLLLERGGMFSVSPSGQLGVAIDVAEGNPLVVELNGFDFEFEHGTVPSGGNLPPDR